VRRGGTRCGAIKDVFSNKIVGYSIDTRMKGTLAGAAMRNNGLVGSMGRSYGAGDNASMESSFSLLQENVLDTRRWDTREELRLWLVTDVKSASPASRSNRSLRSMSVAQPNLQCRCGALGVRAGTPAAPKGSETATVSDCIGPLQPDPSSGVGADY
jgi:transposase InsO family protein